MVPKNIAIAGPERAALILVPVHVAFVRLTRPLNYLFNLFANGVLRLFRVQPRDDLDTSYTTGELADMVAESQREGLLDSQESSRLTRTLRSSEATVADVLIPLERVRALPAEPTVADVADSVASSGFSRFPLRAEGGELLGYLHIKDILDLADDPGARVPGDRIRQLPEIPLDARIDVALAALRRARAHLGRAVDGSGGTVGLVTLEDLVESYVGMIRDATHR
jgi:CBS domain containing-hemolysin-like protein